jgi:hypothetical protein
MWGNRSCFIATLLKEKLKCLYLPYWQVQVEKGAWVMQGNRVALQNRIPRVIFRAIGISLYLLDILVWDFPCIGNSVAEAGRV